MKSVICVLLLYICELSMHFGGSSAVTSCRLLVVQSRLVTVLSLSYIKTCCRGSPRIPNLVIVKCPVLTIKLKHATPPSG